jgi:hypothetical protein
VYIDCPAARSTFSTCPAAHPAAPHIIPSLLLPKTLVITCRFGLSHGMAPGAGMDTEHSRLMLLVDLAVAPSLARPLQVRRFPREALHALSLRVWAASDTPRNACIVRACVQQRVYVPEGRPREPMGEGKGFSIPVSEAVLWDAICCRTAVLLSLSMEQSTQLSAHHGGEWLRYAKWLPLGFLSWSLLRVR